MLFLHTVLKVLGHLYPFHEHLCGSHDVALSDPIVENTLAWSDIVDQISSEKTDVSTLQALLQPFAVATAVSYTGRTSYSVPGFHIVNTLTPTDGLHAYAYQHHSVPTQVLIVFRGTTSPSDSCADAVLWQLPLPETCAKFSNETLDYITQAKSFVASTLDRISQSQGSNTVIDLAFTGHSLGCGLTSLTTLGYATDMDNKELEDNRAGNHAGQIGSVRGICFAEPGTELVAERLGLDLNQADKVLAIANPYDPIVWSTQDYQVGTSCAWNVKDVAEPKACTRCKHYNWQKSSPMCHTCYESTHIFNHYLDALKGMQLPFVCTDKDSGE